MNCGLHAKLLLLRYGTGTCRSRHAPSAKRAYRAIRRIEGNSFGGTPGCLGWYRRVARLRRPFVPARSCQRSLSRGLGSTMDCFDAVDYGLVQQILSLTRRADEETLRELNRMIIRQLRGRSRAESASAIISLESLRPGTIVTVNHPNHGPRAAKLIQVRRTRVLVQFEDDPRRWTVPAHWIEV